MTDGRTEGRTDGFAVAYTVSSSSCRIQVFLGRPRDHLHCVTLSGVRPERASTFDDQLIPKIKSALSNLGKGPRRGAVAHVRRKVPIGYNGAPQIRPQKYPLPWTDPQTTLHVLSLDPSDL